MTCEYRIDLGEGMHGLGFCRLIETLTGEYLRVDQGICTACQMAGKQAADNPRVQLMAKSLLGVRLQSGDAPSGKVRTTVDGAFERLAAMVPSAELAAVVNDLNDRALVSVQKLATLCEGKVSADELRTSQSAPKPPWYPVP